MTAEEADVAERPQREIEGLKAERNSLAADLQSVTALVTALTQERDALRQKLEAYQIAAAHADLDRIQQLHGVQAAIPQVQQPDRIQFVVRR